MYKLENVPREYFPGGPPLLLINTLFEWNEANNNEPIELVSQSPMHPKHQLIPESTSASPPPPPPASLLKPTLVNNEYFLIGNSTGAQNMYSLSITISFAENLLDLFTEEKYWPPPHTSCHFQFSLLGQPISFRPFNQLRYQVDVGEKATARIKCSPKTLLKFLEHSMPSLSILFCCEDIPLGEVLVPIWERIKQQGKERHILNRLHMEPVNIAGMFQMESLLQFERPNQDIHSTTFKPQMGVVFLLSQIPTELLNHSAIDTSFIEPHSNVGASTSANNATSVTEPAISLEDMMYATALELEVWKEEQKLLEREKQERARVEYLELLNCEYRRQVVMKETAYDRRVKKVHDLERQLESTIEAVQKSEKEVQQQKLALTRRENQIVREKIEMSVEVERVTQQLERKHKLEMDAIKKRHADVVSVIRRQHKEEQARVAQLEETIRQLKRGNN